MYKKIHAYAWMRYVDTVNMTRIINNDGVLFI